MASHKDLNIIDAIEAKEKGMKKAMDNARVEFKEMLSDLILAIARSKPKFCSDDIVALLNKLNVGKNDRRVLGPMLKVAQAKGICRPLVCVHCHSVVTSRTAQKKSHASPMQYWESLVYEEGATYVNGEKVSESVTLESPAAK